MNLHRCFLKTPDAPSLTAAYETGAHRRSRPGSGPPSSLSVKPWVRSGLTKVNPRTKRRHTIDVPCRNGQRPSCDGATWISCFSDWNPIMKDGERRRHVLVALEFDPRVDATRSTAMPYVLDPHQ